MRRELTPQRWEKFPGRFKTPPFRWTNGPLCGFGSFWRKRTPRRWIRPFRWHVPSSVSRISTPPARPNGCVRAAIFMSRAGSAT